MKRFVVGTGRCGSTLLSRLLHQSPEMASLCEYFNGLDGARRFAAEPITGAAFWELIAQPHPFVTIVVSRGYKVEEIVYPYDRPGVRARRDDHLPWIQVSMLPRLTDDPDRLFDQAHEFVLAQPVRQPRNHHVALFDWLATTCGKRVWNERSGSSIDYLGDLRDNYPDARFLHIHRAGEEAALSMREHAAFRLAISLVYRVYPELDAAAAFAHSTPPTDGSPDPFAPILEGRPPVEYFGRFWSDQLMRGYRAIAGLDRSQYAEVRFEDLVARPHETLRWIAEFFEIDPAAGGWIERAAALVRGVPPARGGELPAADRARLAEICRPGNQLLGR